MNKIILQGKMIGIHGPPGIGKTQLAAKFPRPTKLFATEPGYTYLSKQIKEDVVDLPPEADSWSKFLNGIDKISKFKTVVLDTAGGLFDICQLHTCRKMNIEHPSDAPHGKGWDGLKTEFIRGMGKLAWKCQSKKSTLIFICHSKTVTLETKTSQFEKIMLNLTGTARGVLVPVPDHIWFMGYHETHAAVHGETAKRALYLDGSSGVEAKCRDPRVSTTYIAPLKKNKPYEQILSVLNTKKEKKA